MLETQPLSVCVLTKETIRNLGKSGFEDVFTYRSPRVVVVETERDRTKISPFTDAEVISLNMLSRGGQLVVVDTDTDIDLVFAPSHKQLGEIGQLEKAGEINTDTETYILSEVLDVDVNLVDLETTLVGKDKYQQALPETGSSYTHLSAKAAPDYRSEWDAGFIVQGVNPEANDTDYESDPEVAYLKLFGDGVVSSQTVKTSRFGLEALNQVGPNRIQKLDKNLIHTVDDVLDASVAELSEISGIGVKTAEKIYYSAKALAEQKAIRLTEEPLPTNPLYIDIETDGLTPTMVWLIGVYDPQTDRYMPFMATDPSEKGKAVTAFMDWFTANVENRTLVAYNGVDFDFDVLTDHINQHCPEYADAWERARTLDLLFWATKQNNALLPGYTNKLGDVAEALGWDGPDLDVTGQVVGERFSRWMDDPCDENALDWERYERYCESDVRSLAHILETLREAEYMKGQAQPTTTTAGNSGGSSNRTGQASKSKQGTLGDF